MTVLVWDICRRSCLVPELCWEVPNSAQVLLGEQSNQAISKQMGREVASWCQNSAGRWRLHCKRCQKQQANHLYTKQMWTEWAVWCQKCAGRLLYRCYQEEYRHWTRARLQKETWQCARQLRRLRRSCQEMSSAERAMQTAVSRDLLVVDT